MAISYFYLTKYNNVLSSYVITLKNEYFFLVDWFPADPISDDWLGKEGVLPAEIVFLSQEEADVAGDPKGDTHEEDPGSEQMYFCRICIYK